MGTAPNGHPWLVADLGGTNVRFGLVPGADRPVTGIRAMPCHEHASLDAAALAYLADAGVHVHRAAVALAAPVESDVVALTNSDWVVSRQGLSQALGFADVLLLNDFEALAIALPSLNGPGALRFFGGGVAEPRKPMVVLGPGTGLGVSGCIPTASGWVALRSEGGHATLAAGDAFEDALLARVRAEHEHVSAERLLSGRGLPTLHRAVCALLGAPVEALTAEAITDRALHGGDAAARTTLDRFWAMLGGFAGNAALTVGAEGGVYLAGGIAQRLADSLVASSFRERFEAKGRFRDYLQRIATAVVVAPHAALTGAAMALASRPAEPA